MSLHFEVFPQGLHLENCKPLVILPGLFGSISNWRSFAKELSKSTPVVVLDMRNHGRSPHYDSHSYIDMANDVEEFCQQHKIRNIIPCGHSMGGKVALTFSLLFPHRVSSLVILDIAPVTYTHSHAPFLEALIDIDLKQIESRKHADKLLEPVIADQSTRLFLLQSLVGRAGSFSWRLNLPVLRDYMPQIVSFPEQELAGKTSNIPTALVYGANSGYVDAKGISSTAVYFSDLYTESISEAAHWLHIDQPALLIEAVKLFLRKVEKND